MSWRNARFYLGPGDPFGRDDDNSSPPRSKETKIIERVYVRENIPPEIIEQLDERMIEIAVDCILESKKQRRKT